MRDIARKALLDYGYTRDATGRYIRLGKRTQSWQEVDNGWLRFEADGSACPLRVCPEVDAINLSILEPSHAQYFDWVYPDEEILKIYANVMYVEYDNVKTASMSEPEPVVKRRRWQTLWLRRK